ncbi:MAG: type II secretion system F family protein [Acidimicrobiales bacterium]|nr:type II secretion system F family protein [Acidimicrobiales bacterium]
MAPELIVVAVLGCLVAARRSARSPRVRLSTLSGRRGRRSGGPLVAAAIGRVRRRRAGELAARQLPVLLDHVAWALRIAVVAGGAPAAALEGVAASVRDREAVRREARALTAQAVASAVLLVVAPLAFGVLLASGDAEVRHFLLAVPIGLACLLAAAVLDVLGALWMRAVARVAR